MNLKLPYNLLKDLTIFTLTGASRLATYPYLFQKASYRINQRGVIKLTKQAVTTYLILFFAFSSVAGLFLFNPFGADEAEAAWFNDNWAYRKTITATVATNAADRTNVDLYLTIDTTGITANLQTNCEDLRFTNNGGNILPYYIQSCNDNSATNKIFVRANLIPKNSTTFTMYMYYGNPSAVAGSSANTFNLYAGINGYWSFEETSAWATNCSTESVLDSSGNNTTFAPCPNGSPATQDATGKFGSSVLLDGSADRLDSLSDDAIMDVSASENLTVSAWVNFSSTVQNGGIIQKKSGSANTADTGWMFTHFSTGNGGNFCIYVSDGTTQEEACTASYTTLSTWVHVVAVYDRTSSANSGVWINGVRDVSASNTFGSPSAVGNLSNTSAETIGSLGTTANQYLAGEIDDVRMYKRALSQSEISQLYSNTTGSIAVTNSFASEEKGPSPTLYWEFDQGQGTTAEDTTSNALDGTLNNTPTWQTENFCIASKCLFFDGANNENVSIADDPKLDFAAADNFTLGAWVKRSGASSANTVILQKSTANIGSTYTGYKLYMDASGDLCFDTQDGTNAADSACTSSVDFDDDAWHFVQGVKAGTTSVTLYVDGKQRAQDASIASTGTLANASTFRVGIDSDGTSNDWPGFIDEVKVFRDQTTRTAAQVLADYNARSNPEGVSQQQGNNNQNMPAALSNGLVGYWKMDEASWTNNCSTESVLDSSGNSNNGAACPNSTGPTGGAGGKFGFAGNFDGSNDYLDVDDSTSLNTTGSWTVSTWFYNSDSTLGASEKYLLSKGDWDTDADSPYRLLSNYGTMEIQYRKNFTPYTLGYDYNGAGIYAIDQWIHVTSTYDAATNSLAMYFNGKLVAGPTVQADVYEGNSSALYIGAHSPGSGIWDGKIDETRIYNRNLSAAEASQLYNWAPGPNAYWRLDEGSGSTAYDSSGNGNNSTSISGSPSWTSGKYGKTINFDGTNDSVNINESTTTDFGKAGQSYTVMTWVKNSTSNTVTQPLLSKNASSDAPGVFTLRNNWTTNKPEFIMTNSAWSLDSIATGTTTIRDGKWHHLAGIRNEDTNQVYIYVDGNLEGTATDNLADTDISSDKPVIIGGESNGGTYWPGPIDEVKLYNYARTQSQIIEDMNAGHPAPGSPVSTPVGYWKFNEGALNTCVGGVLDYCNAGSGGTIVDMTEFGAPDSTNAGKFGKALNFVDANNDLAFAADSSAVDLTGDQSTSFWIKTTDTNATITSHIDLAGQFPGYGVGIGQVTAGRVTFWGSNNVAPTPAAWHESNSAINDGLWKHIAVVFTTADSSVRFYINGRLDATVTGVETPAANTAVFAVGGGDFDGTLDEVKLYGTALTAEQVALDMNRGSAQVLGAAGTSSTAGNDNASTRTAQSADSEYCIPGDATTCTSPVARWDFEEGVASGGTNFDTSGNANNCTTDGTIRAGKTGKARNYTEAVRLSCGTGSTLANLAALTAEAWVYPRDMGEFNYGTIFTKNDFGGAGGWGLIFDGSTTNGIQFFADHTGNDLYVPTTSNALTLNTWNHVAVTWTGGLATSTVHIYVNGREATYGTGTAGTGTRISDSSDTLFIGESFGQNNGFDGIIDQARIFNYVRTQPQIAYDMNRGGPVAYWKFDECQGTTINDSAGNSLSGTWSGSGGTYTTPGTCTVSSASSAWYNGAVGKRNYSLAFDGSDDIVDFGTPTKLNLPDSIAMSVWVKPDSAALGANYHAMIGNYDGGGTTAQYEFSFKDGNLNYNYGASSSYVEYTPTTSIPFTAGNWYHVIFTHSGSNSTGYFYVNGVKYSTNKTGSASIPTAGFSNTTVGRGGPSGDYFSGQIDDFKIFNYTFNDTLAKTLYNQGAANYGPITGAP